ncbi:hypothetical protein [Heliorestis convoluta]|uniref:Uncharacterized protein n=1 Tax=Heliorestis convoluta TaxID=356322 RepID=A0A5Q2N3G5_9FIRM|nr:hypothetical protein [Heliorestis convoluta]QGG46870.1 hypothetical protein FTV88_0692 [Heliorestis convoluta]
MNMLDISLEILARDKEALIKIGSLLNEYFTLQGLYVYTNYLEKKEDFNTFHLRLEEELEEQCQKLNCLRILQRTYNQTRDYLPSIRLQFSEPNNQLTEVSSFCKLG